MERLGIIGGLGIQASAEFYRRTLVAVRKSTGRTPSVVMYSIPVLSDLEYRFVSGGSGFESELAHYSDAIGTAIDVLSIAGASIFAMPCFSLTPLLISIAKGRSASIVNPFAGLQDTLAEFGSEARIGILATPYGVGVLARYLQRHLVVVPPPHHVQIAVVRAVEMVLAGRDTDAKQTPFQTACEEYRKMIDVMVIGCSEVSIITKPMMSETVDLLDILIGNTANALVTTIEQDKSSVGGKPLR